MKEASTMRCWNGSELILWYASSGSCQESTSRLAFKRAGLTLLGMTLVPCCSAQRMSTCISRY